MDKNEEKHKINQTPYQLFGNLSDEEFQVLKADVDANGVIVPIVIDENNRIIDGHQRFKAWHHERNDVPDHPVDIQVEPEAGRGLKTAG